MSETTCCIVGAGPGGAVLALLLARQGINVTLLEAHDDFDRDFRGDTQKRIIAAALRSDKPLQVPLVIRVLLHVPIIRDIPARIIAHGFKRVRLKKQLAG